MLSPERNYDTLDYTFKLLIVIALVITAIVLASDIIVPMAFAGLLSIVLLPAVKKLEDRKVPTTLAITLVLTVTICLLGLFIWLIIDQIVRLTEDLPNLTTKFETFTNEISRTLKRDFGFSNSEQNKMIGEAFKSLSTYAGELLLSTTNILSAFVQVPIYIFLFLIYRDKFREFFLSLIKSESMQWRNDVKRVVQGYISGLLLVTIIIAALNTIGLLIVGIDHAIFFGILSGVLTIIPYVGIIIGALFPIVMALITKDSIWYTVGVIIVFSVVQFLEGNFITPRITGSKVSINAFGAIIALLLGGKILGIAGMILAVPAIGLVKIFSMNSARLKPFALLLDDQAADSDTDTVTQQPSSEETESNE